MADRAISELAVATGVTSTDKFVLEQGGVAKQLTGQVLTNWLVNYAEGHGGIKQITLTSSVGNVDTYTITYASTYFDGNPPIEYPYTSTFTVTNGTSVASVDDKWAVSSSNSTVPSTWYDSVQTLTEQNRYLWHYQVITLTDFSTLETEKAVTGVYGDRGYTWYTYVRYSAVQPTRDSDIGVVPDDWIGLYCGTSSTAPTHYTEYTWFKWKGEKGDTGTSITSITGPVTTGLQDVYTINFSNNTSTTFTVTNGSSIDRIAQTSVLNNVRTYTVYLTNGDTTTFDVTDGISVTGIVFASNDSPGGAAHTHGYTDTYNVNYSNGTSSQITVYNGSDGSGAVNSVAGIGVSGASGDVPLIVFANQAPDNTTEGQPKQQIYDRTSGIMYICTEVNGAVYTWNSIGSPIDNALNISSSNPVQNSVITTKVGTASLTTTAQNLSGAVNELDAEVDTLDSLKMISGSAPPTSSTAGVVHQPYFDTAHNILYVCTAADTANSTYTWAKAGVTVDSSLSASSTNPVQNNVISNKLIPLDSTMATIHTLTNSEYSYMFNTVLGLGNVATLSYVDVQVT